MGKILSRRDLGRFGPVLLAPLAFAMIRFFRLERRDRDHIGQEILSALSVSRRVVPGVRFSLSFSFAPSELCPFSAEPPTACAVRFTLSPLRGFTQSIVPTSGNTGQKWGTQFHFLLGAL